MASEAENLADARSRLEEYLAQDLANEKLRSAEYDRHHRRSVIAIAAMCATLIAIIAGGTFSLHMVQAAHKEQLAMMLEAKKEICRLQATRPEGAIIIIGQESTSSQADRQ